MQLSIIRRDSTPAGREELRAESFTVTVKDRAEEPAPAKPGMEPSHGVLAGVPTPLSSASSLRREADDPEAASAARHGSAAAGGEAA